MTKQMNLLQKIDALLLQHPVVDTTISAIDHILLRPIPITWASSLAVLGTGYIYLTAHDSGFALSGSEAWVFFVAGWIIGVVSEITVYLIRQLNSK